MHSIKTSIIVLVIMAVGLAQNMNIRGKVINNSGNGVPDAIVKLLSSNQQQYTRADGSFSFDISVNSIPKKAKKSLKCFLKLTTNRNSLYVYAEAKQQAIIDIYNINGQILFTLRKELNAGPNCILLPQIGSGVFLYNIKSSTGQIDYIRSKLILKNSGSSITPVNVYATIQSNSILDTIEVSKKGYHTFRKQVTNIDTNAIEIHLPSCDDSIAGECSVNKTNWDTTFSISGNSFPDNDIYARAILSYGDQLRMKWFNSRLIKADTIKIGFIGGSITEGSLANPISNSYPNRLGHFLSQNFPSNYIKVINAGKGASTSKFGCGRIKDDLFIQKPDLIIIEFSVNDGPYDSTSFEGLVRQCLKNIDGPVILFFTMRKDGSNNQESESKIGFYYDLPMISYKDAIWPLVNSGSCPWTSIGGDVVHPNNDGCLICAYLLYSFIKESSNVSSKLQYIKPTVPNYLYTDFYEFSGIYDTTTTIIQETLNSGWTKIVDPLARLGCSSRNMGDSIIFTSTARELLIGYRYWNQSRATVQVILDGTPIGLINNYFEYDWGGGYIPFYPVYKDEVSTKHIIKLINNSNDLFIIHFLLYTK